MIHIPSSEEDIFIRKAWWAYYHYIKKTDQPLVEKDFQNSFFKNWQLFNHYAFTSEKNTHEYATRNKTLYLCWHFPEYPLFLKSISKNEMLVLVAENTDWIEAVIPREKTYNFREAQMNSKLIQNFKDEKAIVCMFDYCYPSTKYCISDFLGYPSKTPFGIIKLAQIFNYSLLFVNYTEDGILEQINISHLANLQDTIDIINKKIEESILSLPSRWLLWPSVNNRWQNVDYDL